MGCNAMARRWMGLGLCSTHLWLLAPAVDEIPNEHERSAAQREAKAKHWREKTNRPFPTLVIARKKRLARNIRAGRLAR